MHHWFTDLSSATSAAARLRRPILSLRLLGHFDEELTCANSRFFKRYLYRDPQIAMILRDRFVLHWASVRRVPIATIDFGDGHVVHKPITGNSLHLVLDATGRPLDALPGLFAADVFAKLLLGGDVDMAPRPPHRAVAASLLAPAKHVVEAPLLRALVPPSVDADTRTNLALHRVIRDAFRRERPETRSVDALVAWIYRELFLMPLQDPALGLDVPDPF